MLRMMKYRLEYLKLLRAFVPDVGRLIVLAAVCGLAAMCLSFIPPAVYGYYIDSVFMRKDVSVLPWVVLGYLAVYAAETLTAYLKTYLTNVSGNRIAFHVRWKLWKAFQYHAEGLTVGDMKMRMEEDTEKAVLFASAQSSDCAVSFLTIAVSTALLFGIDWRIGLFSVITIPLTFFIDAKLSHREMQLLEGNRQYEEELSTWLHESIGGWQEVKALNLQKQQELKYLHFLHRYAMFFSVWINYWVARALIVPRMKDEFFMRFGLYFMGGLLIADGSLRISGLLMAAVYYGLMSDAVKALSGSDADLKTMLPNLERVKAVLESGSRYGVSEETKTEKNMKDERLTSVSFRDVVFSYDGERQILDSCSFDVMSGERVAFTGKSGSGKTTALKLISGMLEPDSGSIFINGTDMKNIDRRRLNRDIGTVTQESILFNDTVRENLLYGNDSATEDMMRDACRKAGILPFIESLPEGFDTVIGEKGVRLSGGQRQRIALARAFLRDVGILLLDEATSALDQQSEQLVNDAIRNMSGNCTVISVAHRESSIRMCERSISFDSDEKRAERGI